MNHKLTSSIGKSNISLHKVVWTSGLLHNNTLTLGMNWRMSIRAERMLFSWTQMVHLTADHKGNQVEYFFGLILVFLSSENILKRGSKYIFYHIRNPCLCGGAVALHKEHFTGLWDFCHFKFKPSDLQSFFKALTLWNINALKSHCPATKSSALNVSVATRL